MTICIGVLAADERAVVCVADKYVSYGQEILGETDAVKIVRVSDNGAHALISGNDSSTCRVLAKLIADEDIGKDRLATARKLEGAYREAEREVHEIYFLRPFISIADYEQALLKKRVNTTIASISEAIRANRVSDEPAFDCAIVLCGFDTKGKPYLLELQPPGVCTDATMNGFSSIGSGSDYALQRLLGSEWSRKYAIDRALYEIFDAKVQAENDMHVGYKWDALVITADKCTPVPEETKKMIDYAWIDRNRSPYEEHNPVEDLPLPPADWMPKLKEFSDTILPLK